MADFLLNLADDIPGDVAPHRGREKKSYGRPDRPKSRKAEKRPSNVLSSSTERPSKKSRITESENVEVPLRSDISGGQVISSLFTRNPTLAEQPTIAKPITTLRPSNAPLNASDFNDLGLNSLITNHLSAKLSINRPTAVQSAALPVLLSSEASMRERDVFIQSQTGSGKTLSFLLPIIQDLLPLSSQSWIDRSIGTLAIVIAPTRELASQISEVLENLLTLRLRPQKEADASLDAPRLTRWLVSGLLTGGGTRTHEKARLRKGVPVVVSTPGRLLDHLQNTSTFDVGKCRWLILDEADRLMELGFEDTIKNILHCLDGRRKLAVNAAQNGITQVVGDWDWWARRRVVLCSATIRDDVKNLAGTALVDPVVVKQAETHADPAVISAVPIKVSAAKDGPTGSETLTPPSQLSQKFIVSPLKLRLVSLVALLRSIVAKSRRASKIIVFFTCTDSVDFHWRMLGNAATHNNDEFADDAPGDTDGSETEEELEVSTPESICMRCPLIPYTDLYRLHGSLPQSTRQASLRSFAAKQNNKTGGDESSSILFCTSVASRGLDLPLVRAVVQYDLPTENGATEYVHRVGRTARAGKGGEAWSFVSPNESNWVEWVQNCMRGDNEDEDAKRKILLEAVSVGSVLREGFGGEGKLYEQRATQVQLSFERWVLQKEQNAVLARSAYTSHLRAYATHPSEEKSMFHVKDLHLGHLAKAFALRESPSVASKSKLGSKRSSKAKNIVKAKPAQAWSYHDKASTQRRPAFFERSDATAADRMRNAVRKQGKSVKKGGQMMSSGANDFQVTNLASLEKLVRM